MKLQWQPKAKIINVWHPSSCGGGHTYRFIQKTFGHFKANPISRIPAQVVMGRWILEMSEKVNGKTFFAVGTGHNPIVPIRFFLCRENKVITVDPHKRFDFGILRKPLVWMTENRDELWEYYDSVAGKVVFVKGMKLIGSLKYMPEKLLSEANIQYLASADAADINLLYASLYYHISTTFFEYIPRSDINRI